MTQSHSSNLWREAAGSGAVPTTRQGFITRAVDVYAFSYSPGDSLAGALITAPGSRYYLDKNGILQTAAAGVVRDAHYINGVRHTLCEQGRTNLALWCRDLTNAVWTKTNATVAKDQTGADGVVASASRITATANDATVIQSITATSALRAASAWVKRLTGTGTISMSLDGGTTWTVINPGASYAQLSVPRQTLANPAIGFKLATSGDEIAVDFSQVEQSIPSSPIPTTNATVARGGESIGLPVGTLPSEFTIYADATDQGVAVMLVNVRLVQLSASANTVPRVLIFAANAGHFNAQLVNNAVTVTTANQPGGLPAKGDRLESVAQVAAGGTIASSQSINGAPSTSAVSPAITPAAAWTGQYLWLGTDGTSVGLAGVTAIRSVRIASGIQTLEQLRGGSYIVGTVGPDARQYVAWDGSGDYDELPLTPVSIVADGSDLLLTTAGGTPAALIAASGDEYLITTDLTQPPAAQLYVDGKGNLIVVPNSASLLDVVQVGQNLQFC